MILSSEQCQGWQMKDAALGNRKLNCKMYPLPPTGSWFLALSYWILCGLNLQDCCKGTKSSKDQDLLGKQLQGMSYRPSSLPSLVPGCSAPCSPVSSDNDILSILLSLAGFPWKLFLIHFAHPPPCPKLLGFSWGRLYLPLQIKWNCIKCSLGMKKYH